MSISITVLPGSETVSCPTGLRLHEVLAHMGKPLTTPCGGNGTCGKCLVWIASKPSDDDPWYESNPFHEITFHQVRACQYVVCESLYVRLSEESQLLMDASQILTSHQPLDVPGDDAIPLTLAHLAADALANLQ
ncbi:MAG: 2Fe-2S iron-sulfur cluster-binding protein, partial [Planctomycetaceae bacterium]|nr:2Fe-2S iron-sulfur cluster-binding protein [Planctomycetaceae bacterium]